jgi:hypothetical protein
MNMKLPNNQDILLIILTFMLFILLVDKLIH